ncbi:hypothetical protein ASF20_10570 [Methylobacterium sp. Leaf88]|nr:hypothetical protein ASF20_10570 [Methylobacterium sp. Leaf88]
MAGGADEVRGVTTPAQRFGPIATAWRRPTLALPFRGLPLRLPALPHDLDTSLPLNDGRCRTPTDLGRHDAAPRAARSAGGSRAADVPGATLRTPKGADRGPGEVKALPG